VLDVEEDVWAVCKGAWVEESWFRKAEGGWCFEEILRSGEICCLLSRARLRLGPGNVLH
jgi:hypothetical protein